MNGSIDNHEKKHTGPGKKKKTIWGNNSRKHNFVERYTFTDSRWSAMKKKNT